MALCSKPGIAWVKARVRQPDFEAIASQFALDLAKRLKMDKRPSAERKPEPSLDVALQFSRGKTDLLGNSVLFFLLDWLQHTLKKAHRHH